MLGDVYLDAGLPDSMEAVNRRILQIDPHNVVGLENIAYAEYARGDVNQAIRDARGAFRRPGLSM